MRDKRTPKDVCGEASSRVDYEQNDQLPVDSPAQLFSAHAPHRYRSGLQGVESRQA